MKKFVQDIMSKDVVTTSPATSVVQVARCMAKRSIRHIVVTDKDGMLVGLISHQDVVRHYAPWLDGIRSEDRNFGQPPQCFVRDIMILRPFTVESDTTLKTAAALLAAEKIGCLPVLDGKGHPVGIVSVVDMLLTLEEYHFEDENANQEFEFYSPPAVIDKDNNLVISVIGLNVSKSGALFASIGYKSDNDCMIIKLHKNKNERGARQVNRVKKDFVIPVADIVDHFEIDFRGPFEMDEQTTGELILTPRMPIEQVS